MNRVLVIAAHPDDETLGAGGVMARHVAVGDSVSVVILAQGITSRKTKGENSSVQISKLRENAKQALAVLGVKDVLFLDFPDNSMDTVPFLDIVKEVEKLVTEKTPDIIYTHHWGDLNIDHVITFNAVLTACRPPNSTVQRLLCFETLSSTEWSSQTSANVFRPTVFVDISSFLSKKLAALSAYKGEMRPYPHPRSIEGVELLAKTRGLVIQTKSAEAFELVREIIR